MKALQSSFPDVQEDEEQPKAKGFYFPKPISEAPSPTSTRATSPVSSTQVCIRVHTYPIWIFNVYIMMDRNFGNIGFEQKVVFMKYICILNFLHRFKIFLKSWLYLIFFAPFLEFQPIICLYICRCQMMRMMTKFLMILKKKNANCKLKKICQIWKKRWLVWEWNNDFLKNYWLMTKNYVTFIK